MRVYNRIAAKTARIVTNQINLNLVLFTLSPNLQIVLF